MMSQQTIKVVTESPNYWWLLIIAIIPVLLGVWLKGKK